MDKNICKYFLFVFLGILGIINKTTTAQISDNKTDSIQQRIQSSNDNTAKSELFFQLAGLYSENNQIDSALYYFNLSYSLLPDTLNYEADKILNEIGLIYYRQGDFTNALSYFKKALYIAKAKNDSTLIARRYSNIGVVFDHLGDYVTSFEYYHQALKIFEEKGSKRGMAFIYNNMGVISEEMGDSKNALRYHQKSLELKLAQNNKSGAGNSMNNIGVVYEQLFSEYDSSLYYYRKALEVFKEVGDNHRIATSYSNIGVVFWLKHNPDSSIYYSEKAIEIRKSLNDDDGLSSTLFNLGRTYFDVKNYPRALTYYLQSLEISKRINSRKRIVEIYEALASLYNKTQHYNKAYSYHVKYTNLKDSIINDDNNNQIAELKTRYEVEKKDKQLSELSLTNKLQKQSINRYNFLLVSVFVIILLIAVVTLLLIRHNQLKMKQQTLELQQKLLRSQMNPHFIFNTLFSIQTYMLENDAISASRFLSRFAKLMRHILENSKHEFVSLEDELEFLNQYLFIQQLRFNESFKYEVVFDEKEEPSKILIPPMLSQPFVENAIDHGIRSIEKGGIIKIEFKIRKKTLIVKIADNGVGFYHKKENTDQNHKSTGVENAKHRIQLLNNAYKLGHLLEIRDLSQENTGDSGTIITFAIPLISA